jgi:hypothetical protein
LKRAGKTLRLVDLRPWASTRMYTSWGEIARGFGKNAVALQGSPRATLGLAALGFVVATLPWAALAGALVVMTRVLVPAASASAADGSSWDTVRDALAALVASPAGGTATAALAVVVFVFALQAALRVRAGARAWSALFLPVAYTLVAWVLVGAALRTWTGGTVEWKGRRYRAGRE